MNNPDPIEYFRFRQVKAAKVSEVSEATAASPVPPSERVNFHIGNPVQDSRLVSAYLQMILDPLAGSACPGPESPEVILNNLQIEESEKHKAEFLLSLIWASAPYMPRGGFLRNNPNFLVKYFYDWLISNEHEPLSYDLGEETGKREIILASGGVKEALRMLLHALSSYMLNLPVRVLIYGTDIPLHFRNLPGLEFEELPADEAAMTEYLGKICGEGNEQPVVLILGKFTTEETRRNLRLLSLHGPLFFVEANDAPNHHSLAREAKMMNRVLRILTPGVFSPELKNLATVFIAGNPDFLKIIETVHFQLKGTPSSSEIEFLSFLIKYYRNGNPEVNNKAVEYSAAGRDSIIQSNDVVGRSIEKFGNKLNRISALQAERARNFSAGILDKHSDLLRASAGIMSRFPYDKFAGTDALALLDEFALNIDSDEWKRDLENGFLFSFLKHHPQYEFGKSVVVSGSSRTGLGLLGYHCGIKEVIFPDLSWTYEHCFPSVAVVPLTDEFELDTEALVEAVKSKLSADPGWAYYGAVALNNPHNATGKKFREADLVYLLKSLLGMKVFVIDDLSYQNVEPSGDLNEIKTLRQITNGLVETGYLSEEQSDYLITIHSLSKTDSYAGARLSVAEIRHEELLEKFKTALAQLKPNVGAIFLAYLFYRNDRDKANSYWRLRNGIFRERMNAIGEAVTVLPAERNRFSISIKPPAGSMYPQMMIDKLPPGLSLDWLASGLARQGIGLIPLSTFARTEKGFETGRKTFRLTLGGTDDSEILFAKTRRVLIDLNRMIAEEASNYNRILFPVKQLKLKQSAGGFRVFGRWDDIEELLRKECLKDSDGRLKGNADGVRIRDYREKFVREFLPSRLKTFRQRYEDREKILNEIIYSARLDGGRNLADKLEREFFRDSLERREVAFKNRLYDRTVHPTQMYSLKLELLFEELIDRNLKNGEIRRGLIEKTAAELIREFLGLNVAIISSEESSELLLDLKTLIEAENYAGLHSSEPFETFLSFWGDWDGSNRPSGQGHSLVAAVLIENVKRQTKLIQLLMKADSGVKINTSLLNEIEKLSETNKRFAGLLNEISLLTHQLEKRFRGVLPFNVKPGRIRQLGMKLHIARDPLTSLWQHNDRLERKMAGLRKQRRNALEYYFSLNKQLRKTLHALIPDIKKNIDNGELLLEAAMFRDLLKRFIITPRIHQKLITAHDQFAIDTTVQNIYEINEIAGRYGNPGMVLALQVSMSTKPEALISLDRKMRARREYVLRKDHDAGIPSVWIVPLFEEIDSVKNIRTYLNKVWEYSKQSRRLNQEAGERFLEIISEIFVAGSDLSQQIGQAAGMAIYKEAKRELTSWLSEKGMIGKVRMKMGSGEPMQRQGGYYSPVVGKKAFLSSPDTEKRFSEYLKESTRKSTEYAATPLLGIFAGGDLRTFQSSVSEKLRYLPVGELAQILYHVRRAQKFYETEIVRAGEPLVETRLQFKTRGLQELERLTVGRKDHLFDEFLLLCTENFRQILYGREEDVVGIHIISYFIARTTPPLRDRPTIRPGQAVSGDAGKKILEKIAETIPFSKYGSLLRAISHNQSQTAVLGINQLTTGLFRALDSFSQKQFPEGEAATLIEDRILPRLPVYEILHTLRIYHDSALQYLGKMENAFPAGNSAFPALREDMDAMQKYMILFQRELLRRHGLSVGDFFEADGFIPDLLPALRPDLAVLLQPDLFNTDREKFFSEIKGNIDGEWLEEIKTLLAVPDEIKMWREKTWELLEEPVYQRVASFVELAVSLNSLSVNLGGKEIPVPSGKMKLPGDHLNFFSKAGDDNMQQFLAAAFEYLSLVSEGMIEVPINIIRALKEVERIIKIEEQALLPRQQEMLRFCLLQIARLTGENG